MNAALIQLARIKYLILRSDLWYDIQALALDQPSALLYTCVKYCWNVRYSTYLSEWLDI